MKRIIFVILMLSFTIIAQEFATINIYANKVDDEYESRDFELFVNTVKVAEFKNGERLIVKISNPKEMEVSISNNKSDFKYHEIKLYESGETYFLKHAHLSKFKFRTNFKGEDEFYIEKNFTSKKIKALNIDLATGEISIDKKENIIPSEVVVAVGAEVAVKVEVSEGAEVATEVVVPVEAEVEKEEIIEGPNLIIVNENQVKDLNPVVGQLVFTKDTKKLLFFNGSKFKKIKMDDWR